jgi:hypothetical protein
MIPFPIAIAKWLLLNTSLSDEQIASFTSLSVTEITVLHKSYFNVLPKSPIIMNLLRKEEIQRCENDKSQFLKSNTPMETENTLIKKKEKKISKIIKEGMICFLFEMYPSLTDFQIAKLIHSTEKFVFNLRNDTKKIKTIKHQDPFALNIISNEELKSFLNDNK